MCYLTTAENLRKSGNTIPEMEEQILWKNPFLKDIFNNAEFIYKKPLTISQISFQKKSQIENSGQNSASRQMINDYNQLVREYNSLAETTKTLISQYNKQVNNFNNCVAGK